LVVEIGDRTGNFFVSLVPDVEGLDSRASPIQTPPIKTLNFKWRLSMCEFWAGSEHFVVKIKYLGFIFEETPIPTPIG
jgi:hypothetical protein